MTRFETANPSRARRQGGLTLLEVIIAIAVLGIVTAVLTTGVVGNLQKTRTFGGRTEASQILNYFGRRVAGGDNVVLPSSTLDWDYGDLTTAFPELSREGGYAEPDRFRVSITNQGTVGVGSSSSTATRYDVSVCFQAAGGESCLSGTTLGAAPSAAGSAPPLPGMN